MLCRKIIHKQRNLKIVWLLFSKFFLFSEQNKSQTIIRVSLCRLGWPATHYVDRAGLRDLPEIKACATTPGIGLAF